MSGTLVVDDGAVRAIIEQGKSLLPVGVIDVQGDFDAGDVVEIVSGDKVRIAVGQVGFHSDNAKKIIQKHTHEVVEILSLTDTDKAVMIHRDEMAIL